MKIRQSVAAFLATVVLTGQSTALAGQQNNILSNGNDFLETCGGDESYETLLCLGYVRGYVHGYFSGTMNANYVNSTNGANNPRISVAFCLPDGFNYQQVMDVILQFIETRPALRHEPLGLLIHHSLNQGFPCPEAE